MIRPGRSIDELYFTTATRNLALAAMVAAKIVVAEEAVSDASNASIDFPAACSLVARTVTLSGISSKAAGSDGDRRNERTAIFASALALLLKHAEGLDLADSDVDNYISAAIVLTRLSGVVSYDSLVVTPSDEALMARACVGLLLELFEADTSIARADMFVEAVFLASFGGLDSRCTVARALINLVARLDWNVSELLLRVCRVPVGAKIILEFGILQALKEASYVYASEESKVLATHNAASYQSFNVTAPPFFPSHLLLMSALMTIDAPEASIRNVASEVMTILKNYGTVLQRLFMRFPVDGELAHSVARCLMAAKMLLAKTGPSATEIEPRPHSENSSFEAFEQRFSAMTLHIAENPLPLCFLPVLPACLAGSNGPVDSSAVSVTVESDKPWWDNLDIKTTLFSALGAFRVHQLSEDVYAYAIVGADILRCGLYTLRGQMSTTTLTSRTLARVLCRCTDAMRVRIEFVDRHPVYR